MMTTNKLKEFSVSPTAWALSIWGGGHTRETDPSQKGWRVRPLTKGNSIVLVGRRGVEGCFSVQPMLEGDLDIALYQETPEQVAAMKAAGEYVDAVFHSVPNTPGWGLTAIELLGEDMKGLEEYRAELASGCRDDAR